MFGCKKYCCARRLSRRSIKSPWRPNYTLSCRVGPALLLSTRLWNKMSFQVFISIFLLLERFVVFGQYSNNFAYEWKTPLDCLPNEIYNPVILKCKTCDDDQVSNYQHNKCICKALLRTVFGRSQNKCVQCAQGI